MVVGAERVARNLLRFWGQPENALVSYSVGSQPALLGFTKRELTGALLLDIEQGRVTEIHVLADPSKLNFIGSGLALVSPGE